MPRSVVAASGHVCASIRIRAIDMVQPPGIGISSIADMGATTAALATKRSAEHAEGSPGSSLERHPS